MELCIESPQLSSSGYVNWKSSFVSSLILLDISFELISLTLAEVIVLYNIINKNIILS